MILIKMLEPRGGKEFALWQCGRCSRKMPLGFKIGRNRGECYQCEQRTRLQEMVEVFKPKNIDTKIRECLMCGVGFSSWGIANRRCPACAEKISYIETENNLKNAKSDEVMKLVGDRVGSDEELIRNLIY